MIAMSMVFLLAQKLLADTIVVSGTTFRETRVEGWHE
jgi:hypothetical protein